MAQDFYTFRKGQNCSESGHTAVEAFNYRPYKHVTNPNLAKTFTCQQCFYMAIVNKQLRCNRVDYHL